MPLPCNAELPCCATLPTCCRERTYHGPGFKHRFQAAKNLHFALANFQSFDLIFVQSGLWGEANEKTCNTLQIEIIVSQFSFKKKNYHLLLLTVPSPCPLSYCIVYQTTLAKVLHCSYNQSDLAQDLFSCNVCVIMLQQLHSVFFTRGIII